MRTEGLAPATGPVHATVGLVSQGLYTKRLDPEDTLSSLLNGCFISLSLFGAYTSQTPSKPQPSTVFQFSSFPVVFELLDGICLDCEMGLCGKGWLSSTCTSASGSSDRWLAVMQGGMSSPHLSDQVVHISI